MVCLNYFRARAEAVCSDATGTAAGLISWAATRYDAFSQAIMSVDAVAHAVSCDNVGRTQGVTTSRPE
jgi:L-cysteine desulfidase